MDKTVEARAVIAKQACHVIVQMAAVGLVVRQDIKGQRAMKVKCLLYI